MAGGQRIEGSGQGGDVASGEGGARRLRGGTVVAGLAQQQRQRSQRPGQTGLQAAALRLGGVGGGQAANVAPHHQQDGAEASGMLVLGGGRPSGRHHAAPQQEEEARRLQNFTFCSTGIDASAVQSTSEPE